MNIYQNYSLENLLNLYFQPNQPKLTQVLVLLSLKVQLKNEKIIFSDIIRLLQEMFVNENEDIRQKASFFLYSLLKKLPPSFLHHSTLLPLLLFLISRTSDLLSIEPTILSFQIVFQTLLLLPSSSPSSPSSPSPPSCFPPLPPPPSISPHLAALEEFWIFFGNTTKFYLPAFPQKIRGAILQMLKQAVIIEANITEAKFKSILIQIEGEKDPRNILLIFRLLSSLLTLPSLSIPSFLLDDVFEFLECYYPVSFTPPKVASPLLVQIRKEDLEESLDLCLMRAGKKRGLEIALGKIESNFVESQIAGAKTIKWMLEEEGKGGWRRDGGGGRREGGGEGGGEEDGGEEGGWRRKHREEDVFSDEKIDEIWKRVRHLIFDEDDEELKIVTAGLVSAIVRHLNRSYNEIGVLSCSKYELIINIIEFLMEEIKIDFMSENSGVSIKIFTELIRYGSNLAFEIFSQLSKIFVQSVKIGEPDQNKYKLINYFLITECLLANYTDKQLSYFDSKKVFILLTEIIQFSTDQESTILALKIILSLLQLTANDQSTLININDLIFSIYTKCTHQLKSELSSSSSDTIKSLFDFLFQISTYPFPFQKEIIFFLSESSLNLIKTKGDKDDCIEKKGSSIQMQLESKNVNLEAKSMNESRKNEELFFYCLAASFDTLKELNLNGIFNSTQNKSLFFDFLIKILPKTKVDTCQSISPRTNYEKLKTLPDSRAHLQQIFDFLPTLLESNRLIGLEKTDKKQLEKVFEVISKEFKTTPMSKDNTSFNLLYLIKKISGVVLEIGMIGLMRELGTGIIGGLMELLESEAGLDMKREVETYLDKRMFLMPEYKKMLLLYEYRMKLERRNEGIRDEEEEEQGRKVQPDEEEEIKREEVIEINIWNALSIDDNSHASMKTTLVSFSIANILRLSHLSSQIMVYLNERPILLAEFLEKIYRKADKWGGHPFFRQFVFDRLVGQLFDQYNLVTLKTIKNPDDLVLLTRKSLLKSLFILFLQTPLPIKISFLPKIIPILLLSLQDPENHSGFSLLKELLLHPPSSSFPPPPPSSFPPPPPTTSHSEILDFLLESLKKVEKIEVLLDILECLVIGAGLEATLIGNRKNKIISGVRPLLDHRKRRVRKAAREAINKWYGI